MQMNWDGFENPEIVEVSGQLHSLRARRRMCLFEIDEELFFQKHIPQRKARTISKLRVTFLWVSFLTVVIVGIISVLLFMHASTARENLIILACVLFLMFMVPICVTGWIKEIALLRFYYVGKKTVYYDLEQTRSAYKVSELEREITDLDTQIDPLEIRFIQLKEKQKEQAHIEAERKRVEKEQQTMRENGTEMKRGFSLRENVLDDIQITEIISSYDRDIHKVKDKIVGEEEKIRQYEKNIADIDADFAASKGKTLEGLSIIGVIALLQLIPERRLQIILTVMAIIPTVVLLFFYYKELRNSVFNYYFEHEPRMFKDYAFRNDMTTNRQKILEKQKEIRWLQKEIAWIEEQKKEVIQTGNAGDLY